MPWPRPCARAASSSASGIWSTRSRCSASRGTTRPPPAPRLSLARTRMSTPTALPSGPPRGAVGGPRRVVPLAALGRRPAGAARPRHQRGAAPHLRDAGPGRRSAAADAPAARDFRGPRLPGDVLRARRDRPVVSRPDSRDCRGRPRDRLARHDPRRHPCPRPGALQPRARRLARPAHRAERHAADRVRAPNLVYPAWATAILDSTASSTIPPCACPDSRRQGQGLGQGAAVAVARATTTSRCAARHALSKCRCPRSRL